MASGSSVLRVLSLLLPCPALASSLGVTFFFFLLLLPLSFLALVDSMVSVTGTPVAMVCSERSQMSVSNERQSRFFFYFLLERRVRKTIVPLKRYRLLQTEGRVRVFTHCEKRPFFFFMRENAYNFIKRKLKRLSVATSLVTRETSVERHQFPSFCYTRCEKALDVLVYFSRSLIH